MAESKKVNNINSILTRYREMRITVASSKLTVLFFVSCGWSIGQSVHFLLSNDFNILGLRPSGFAGLQVVVVGLKEKDTSNYGIIYDSCNSFPY